MNKKKISNITASARLIYQLGEQLISDELVALMELIKNGYDADATNVEIIVDTKINTEYGQGKIVISDNGNGMLPTLIQGAFLRLSTNYKEVEKISMYFKRRVLGKKGIGRLSFQRLGNYVRVTTTPRVMRYIEHDSQIEKNAESLVKEEDREILQNFDTFVIDIDWANFTVEQDLQDISAVITSNKVERKVYGTKIEIFGIRNLSFWNLDKNKINRLKKEIFGMINPFVNRSIEKFNINFSIDGEKYSNDNINENVLEKSCDIMIDFSFDNWVLKIDVDRKRKYFIREKNKKIEKMKENGFLLSNEKDYTDEKSSYEINFNKREEMNKEFPYLKKVNMDTVSRGDDKKNREKIMAYPGKFEGRIYASDFSSESKQYVKNLIEEKVFIDNGIRLYQELDKIWETANGLYIFRNQFRILPYGSDEWAGFTAKSQTYKNVIYKANTIAGYITIDGESSENLEEQTNRMGLVEDEFGNNFMKLIKNVLVEVIVREDAKFREGFLDGNVSEEGIRTRNELLLFKKIETDTERKQKLFDSIKEAVNYESDLNYLSTTKQTFKYIREQVDDLKNLDKNIEIAYRQKVYEKEIQLDEVRDIIPMVGQGIIVESLTHELKRIDENITTYANNTIKEVLHEIINKTIIKEFQNNIIQETVYLKEQLKHIEPTYKKNVERIEIIDMKDFLEELYVAGGPMVNKAKKKNVDVVITGESFTVSTNRGYLITIFDNLFLNSLYWLDFDDILMRKIYFNVESTRVIEYWDSGYGIHPDIEEDLFRPFKTLKQDGRGLGLYIVQELMSMLNGEIILSDERKEQRKYKFNLKFYES